ncbi:DNA polymerase III subunit delta' [Neisseria gonorrhoeae]|uniref:DNA polymerase III subunit delta n=1 Tax=Neisseria gonorrhoeae TaxID=485 RepID=A0A378VZM4_NEIGO|nr:DNA polymerase III subunit delta' [Neisseria gonorrhoeae]
MGSIGVSARQGVAEPEERLAFHSGAPLFQEEGELRELRAKLLEILAEPRLLKILDYAALFDKENFRSPYLSGGCRNGWSI